MIKVRNLFSVLFLFVSLTFHCLAYDNEYADSLININRLISENLIDILKIDNKKDIIIWGRNQEDFIIIVNDKIPTYIYANLCGEQTLKSLHQLDYTEIMNSHDDILRNKYHYVEELFRHKGATVFQDSMDDQPLDGSKFVTSIPAYFSYIDGESGSIKDFIYALITIPYERLTVDTQLYFIKLIMYVDELILR